MPPWATEDVPERYQRVGYSGWLHTDEGWKPMATGTALAPSKVAADGGTRHSVRMAREFADDLSFNEVGEDEAKSAVREWRKKRYVFTNAHNGRRAEVKSDWSKIFSTPAKRKSASYEAHYAAASKLDALFKFGVKMWEEPPRNGSSDIRAYAKYGCPFALGNDTYLAKITVKEYADEKSNDGFYSVEAIAVEKISAEGINAGITSVEGHELDLDAKAALGKMLTTTEDIIAYPGAEVNGEGARPSVRLKNYWKVLRGPFDRPLDVDVASAGGYTGIRRELAWGMKLGKMDAISEAARRMAPSIPDDAVVVPMPNHEGRAIRTMLLAYAISGEREVNAPLTFSIGRNRKTSLARR